MKVVVWRFWRLLKPRQFMSFVMMLIIWTGVAGALFAAISSDIKGREYLRGRAQTIADSLGTTDVGSLHGNNDDLTTLTYNSLQERLQHARAGNNDLRYIYLIGKRGNGEVFYYMNSEVTNSHYYVEPGKKVTSAGLQEAPLFSAPEATVIGPARNDQGVWMTATAPVLSPVTGQTIAVLAIDTPALTYYGQIALYSLVPLLLAAIPLAGLLRDIKIHNKEQELLHLKNQFVSISSHELRSPLTGMMWAIQSLSRSGASRLNLEQLSMLGAMYHSVESSLATVNEILDFSIFDRGQAKLQRESTDVTTVIKHVVATLSLSAREKRLIIEPTGKWPRHVYVLGDVAALKRAYMNVFSNAIKYSRDATNIEITYELRGTDHVVAIRDHGIGIPDAEKQKVLEGYYRATNATAVEVHGTGLGLLVTKKIIEQHGGKLWIESEMDKGTTVLTSLPVAPDPVAPAAVEATNQAPAESADSVTPAPSLPSKDTP